MKIVIREADIERSEPIPKGLREHYYVEVADNGEIIGTSEVYATLGNAMRAARAKAGLYEEPARVEIEKVQR